MTRTSAVERFYAEVFSDPLVREFYRDSGFANLGYWDRDIADAEQAGNRLVDRLVEMLPDRRGRLLEVACGEGATTRRLADHFPVGRITAVNVSRSQLAAAARRCPGATFLEMDAVNLRFADATFGTVVSIEAAFHFDSRERFLLEALRVLRPGGWLVLSDLLFAPGTPLVPPANELPDLAAYERLVRRVGFREISLIDAHREMWQSFRVRYSDFLGRNAARHGWLRAWRNFLFCNWGLGWTVRGALLLAARKPRRPV